jgi:hypothetical protein
MTQQLQPDDRVLVLQTEAHSAAQLREWAQALTQGVLVGLGGQSAIRNARRELADCGNTMFALGSRDEIPWREAFFTAIFDTVEGDATPEMRRVLHPAGRIYSIQP